MTVSQCIDIIIEKIKKQKRLKNGRFITYTSNAETYHYLRLTLQQFTSEKYDKVFSSFFFKDIDEKFLKYFVLYLQERGVRNGNLAGLPEKLKKFYGVFWHSNEIGQPRTDRELFKCVEAHFKRKEHSPQTIPYE